MSKTSMPPKAWMLALVALAACGPVQPAGDRAKPADEAQAETAYVAPPSLAGASRTPGGRIVLSGRAQPGVQVRLATPAGHAILATADASGTWRTTLPPAASLQLFGLSMSQKDRTVQSEGYLAITPEGRAAQLRSGAAALVLVEPSRALRILAVDFDRQGGAVISGTASPGATVGLAVDGVQRQAQVDADGRFILALNEPLAAGVHLLEAVEGSSRARAEVPFSQAAPLSPGPFRAERTASGWRIDWMTPGGGIQTTLMLQSSETSS